MFEIVNRVLGNASDNHVLIFRQANLSCAETVCQMGEILKITGTQTTDWNMQTRVVKTRLFLRVDSKVRAGGQIKDRTWIFREWTEPLNNEVSERGKTDLVEIEAEAPPRTFVTFAMISPDSADNARQPTDLILRNPGVEGQRIGCLLYTSPSPRDATLSRMPSSA